MEKLGKILVNPKEKELWHTAILALEQIAIPACRPHFLRVLREPSAGDPYMRNRAMEGLAKLGTPGVVKLLTGIALDTSAEMELRSGAVEAMVESGKKVYRKEFVRIVQAPGAPGLSWILSEKTGFRDRRAVPRLCELLRSSESVYVRQSLAEALGRIGDERAVPTLCAALEDKSAYGYLSAARALGQIGSRKALDPLLHRFEAKPDHGDEFNKVLSEALAAIDRDAAGERLLSLMDAKDAGVRHNAAQALGRLRYRRAIPRLRRALEEEGWWVRCQAASALGRLRDRGSFAKLVEMARKGNGTERLRVCYAFKHMKDKRAIPVVVWILQNGGANGAAPYTLRELVGPAVGEGGRNWREWWKREGRDKYGKTASKGSRSGTGRAR